MEPRTASSLLKNGHPRLWISLAALLLTTFVGTWDGAAPVVALPTISREYNVGIDSAVWVITVGSLLFAVPMAIFGKLGDMLGHKRMYILGAGAYILSAALAVVAPTFGWLILFRALQGLASAPWYTATLAFVATAFPAGQRGRAMGMVSTAASLAWASGPVLGGLMMQAFSWKAIILIEIPLAALALLAAWRLMPDDSHSAKKEFDVLGATALTVSALVLMFGLHLVSDWGWTGGPTVAAAALFVSLIALFIRIEMQHRAPFLPLTLFANLAFSAATSFSLVQMTALFGMLLLVPVYLQEAGGIDPATAGLLVAALSFARIFFEPIAGRVAELYGSRFPSVVGTGLLVIVSLSFVWAFSPATPGWVVFMAMFAFGIGFSFGRTPVNMAVAGIVNREWVGLALGVFSMLTFAGGSLGQTTLAVVLRTLAGVGSAPLASASPHDLLNAFALSFGAIAALASLAGVLALYLPGREANMQMVRGSG